MGQPRSGMVRQRPAHLFHVVQASTGLDTELFVMSADGSGVTRLTHVVGVDGSPRPR